MALLHWQAKECGSWAAGGIVAAGADWAAVLLRVSSLFVSAFSLFVSLSLDPPRQGPGDHRGVHLVFAAFHNFTHFESLFPFLQARTW